MGRRYLKIHLQWINMSPLPQVRDGATTYLKIFNTGCSDLCSYANFATQKRVCTKDTFMFPLLNGKTLQLLFLLVNKLPGANVCVGEHWWDFQDSCQGIEEEGKEIQP